LRIRMIRKYPNMHFTFTLQKVCCGNTAGFNLSPGDPMGFQRLQAKLAKALPLFLPRMCLRYFTLFGINAMIVNPYIVLFFFLCCWLITCCRGSGSSRTRSPGVPLT
jgi:hypothetical protein